MGKRSGFTVIELMVVIAIMAIAMAIGYPNLRAFIPSSRLSSALQDLHSNLQQAKIAAIKNNGNCTVTYSTSPDQYVITYPNGTTKTVSLADYGSGVTFKGPTTEDIPADPITFNSRGSSNMGYAYLTNGARTAFYRIGPLVSGVIRIQRHDGGSTWN